MHSNFMDRLEACRNTRHQLRELWSAHARVSDADASVYRDRKLRELFEAIEGIDHEADAALENLVDEWLRVQRLLARLRGAMWTALTLLLLVDTLVRIQTVVTRWWR